MEENGLNSKDIVLLSTADWDNPFWTNKQHVTVALARLGHRVLYIDSLGLRRPSASTRDLHRIAKRLIKAVQPPRKVRDNLWVWSPIMLPWHSNPQVRRINRGLLNAGLWTWLKLLGLKREWLWTYNPLTTEFFNLNSFFYCVYHCVDEIKAQPGMPVEILEEAEEKLSRQVNVIFTTSHQLTETRRAWNVTTYYLPNVADYRHFNSALDPQTIVPRDLVAIPRPRLGFIGAISGYKVDFQLIRQIAEVHPKWSLVLIGKVGEGDPWTDSSPLHGLPNLHLLGPRAYKDLPAYLKGFDVALLPNYVNEYTDAMFPMKFFEYLAAGRPVVSMNLKALSEFTDVALVADTPEQFIAAIKKALAGEIPALDQRLRVAREHTYEARTQRMLALIDGLFGS
jgi:glycosyltransferase involved in cell wall biosynthesis